MRAKKTSKGKKVKSEKDKKKGFGVFISLIGMMVWVAASVIASQFLIGYIMVLIIGVENFGRPVWTAVYSALSYVVAMLLIIMVPAGIKRRRKAGENKKDVVTDKSDSSVRNSLGLRGMPTWVDIGLAPVGFIVYLLIAAGLTALFTCFPWFDAEEVQEVGFSIYVAGLDRIIAFITLVVVAPIAEEIIFRGWLYDKMRTRLSEHVSEKLSVGLSIFLVSLLFGIVHLQWNVGVNVFALSIVLCGLREITGTIYSGILLHMLKNGIAFYLLYVLGIG